MSHWKASGLAIFAVICLLGETTGSAHAQCNSFLSYCATEWSHGKVINLGGLPGSEASVARSINDAGQVVAPALPAGTVTPPSGATAKSSTWEACQAPRLAKPSASTVRGRWWETALSTAYSTPPSGATAASST
jgi:uncharacterized membrane protein